MGALDIQNTLNTIPNEAKENISILTELLRDIDLEGRMITLIKAKEFIDGQETNELQLQSIRADLELELVKMKKMIFMVEKTQYILEASQR
jgi:hypothetical protein